MRRGAETTTITRKAAAAQLAMLAAANPARVAAMTVEDVLRLYNVPRAAAEAAIVGAARRV